MLAPPPGFAWGSDRARALVLVIIVHLLLGYALLAGLSVRFLPHSDVLTRLIDVSLVPPPPPIVPPPKPKQASAARAAAAPALPDKLGGATGPAVVKRLAPVAPIVPIAVTPAPGGVAGQGTAIGAGSGGGTGGEGEGAGDGAGGTELEQIAGEIRQSDYPRSALRAGIGGRVEFRFTVAVTGRVTQCGVTRSSGNADLDAATCRLVVKRFRYRPATDASGRPVAEVVEGEQLWTTDGRGDD